METPATYLTTTLSEAAWTAAQQAHEARLRPILDPYLDARSRGAKNPVLDFLFEYYAFRPSHLLRWSPGLGIALAGAAAAFLEQPEFVETDLGIGLDPMHFPERRKPGIRWIREVLAATQNRAPFFGCHGMHEWAMVYHAEAVRHTQVPLRLSADEIAAVVEARPVFCTHFDAFRFFTPEARPLNHHQPTRFTMPALEQPGCLHTNMDLYKWASKLYPWLPGNLLADTFLLACRIREVDMRASPYDLREAGLEPIPIEKPAGRRQYQRYQEQFMAEAAPLRARLLAGYDALLAWL